jgi:hypothetical protein
MMADQDKDAWPEKNVVSCDGRMMCENYAESKGKLDPGQRECTMQRK